MSKPPDDGKVGSCRNRGDKRYFHMTTLLTEEKLREITGSQQERNEALRRALDGKRASYGWIEITVEDGLLYVESNPFNTVINTQRVAQTEDGGPSIVALGEHFDEVAIENTEEAIRDFLWQE